MVSSSDHIVASFDEELGRLTTGIAEMGGICEQLIADAVTALMRRDLGLANTVIERDKQVDEMQRQIEESAIQMIALRQPMAQDLREVVAAIHVANDLERVGDLAKNTAKRVIAIEADFGARRPLAGLEHIAELSLEQMKNILDAYGQRDLELALQVWERDEEIDALNTSLFRELLTYMMEDPRTITFCTHLLFCSKNLERIGDHATNIAETLHYVVTGNQLEQERPKKDTSSLTAVVFKSDDEDDGKKT